ncbi:hypothetical protein OF83DRAFT_1085711, partial [Amylostereum chailletii]
VLERCEQVGAVDRSRWPRARELRGKRRGSRSWESKRKVQYGCINYNNWIRGTVSWAMKPALRPQRGAGRINDFGGCRVRSTDTVDRENIALLIAPVGHGVELSVSRPSVSVSIHEHPQPPIRIQSRLPTPPRSPSLPSPSAAPQTSSRPAAPRPPSIPSSSTTPQNRSTPTGHARTGVRVRARVVVPGHVAGGVRGAGGRVRVRVGAARAGGEEEGREGVGVRGGFLGVVVVGWIWGHWEGYGWG